MGEFQWSFSYTSAAADLLIATASCWCACLAERTLCAEIGCFWSDATTKDVLALVMPTLAWTEGENNSVKCGSWAPKTLCFALGIDS